MQVQESEHGFVHILHINNKLTTISHNQQDMHAINPSQMKHGPVENFGPKFLGPAEREI